MAKHPPDSPVRKRSVVINGHRTSISLEDAFWNALREIASTKDVTLSALVTQIDDDRQMHKQVNLSSAIRLAVLDYYRSGAELKRRVG